MADNSTYSGHANYNTAVENLQRYLRKLADNGEPREIFAVPIDGIYDTKTREAVAEFQRTRGLPVTGTANKITWDALFVEYSHLLHERDRRVYPDLFPKDPPDYETDFGEKSAFISVLQFLLDELRAAYGTLPEFEMNGSYDGDTSLAVKEFQRINLLPVTGRVNRSTWNAISEAYNRYVR